MSENFCSRTENILKKLLKIFVPRLCPSPETQKSNWSHGSIYGRKFLQANFKKPYYHSISESLGIEKGGLQKFSEISKIFLRSLIISSFVECHFGIKRIKSITYRSKCIFSTLFLWDTKFFWHLFLKALSKFWRIIISNFSCWICAFRAARARFSALKSAGVRVSVRTWSELEALNDRKIRLDTLA